MINLDRPICRLQKLCFDVFKNYAHLHNYFHQNSSSPKNIVRKQVSFTVYFIITDFRFEFNPIHVCFVHF